MNYLPLVIWLLGLPLIQLLEEKWFQRDPQTTDIPYIFIALLLLLIGAITS